MRDGLKKRIGYGSNTLNFTRKEYIKKNSFNNRLPNKNCVSNGNCSTVMDSDGYHTTTNQSNQQNIRKYYAPFRQPLKGYRKTLNCSADVNNNNCWNKIEIYKDNWANNTICNNNGSITTSKLPLQVSTKTTTGNTSRTNKPLIRSGMQPNMIGQQNSGLPAQKSYSYSYHELIKNRRKNSQIKKLATSEPQGESIKTYGYGGECPEINSCPTNETIYRLNNNKFKVQGAVDSSSRIDRLKLDTIRGETKCAPSTQTGPENERRNCNGIYFVGKPRQKFGPPQNDIYCSKQRKYKGLFNINHHEVNYPQTSALARVRGAVSFRTTVNPNGGVCCHNNPPQLLM